MRLQDLHNNLAVEQVIDPAVANSDTNSSGSDLRGFEFAEALVAVGESADTLNGTNKISLEMEESDDDSTYTDVAQADMIGSAISDGANGEFALIDAAAEDDAVYKVGYRGTKRYIRVVLNFSGTHSTGTPIGALVLKGGAHNRPVS